MKIFDSHCHLNLESYADDLSEVIRRAKAAGVEGMMIVGITTDESRQAIEIAQQYPGCYASVGIHPHDADSCSKESLAVLKKLARSRAVKAWGEIGLDFNRMYAPQSVQENGLISQLEAADDLDLPLIFHERDSQGRFLEMLAAYYGYQQRQGVVHCFSGTLKEMTAYLKMGLYIGITGILTIHNRGRQLRALVKEIPMDRMVIETDAPFLTPAPEKNRMRRNEPAFVKSVLFKLADVLDCDPQLLAQTLWKNTCQLYQIYDMLSNN